ncbi:MAG: hypothetical protein J6C11_05770 [Spirochaetaceae bacterium]|nr:hypothetical protein [Spirochaetaceae bacterium]
MNKNAATPTKTATNILNSLKQNPKSLCQWQPKVIARTYQGGAPQQKAFASGTSTLPTVQLIER